MSLSLQDMGMLPRAMPRAAANGAAPRGGPMSVGRVLGVLDGLATAQGPLALAELSRRLEVPKASLLSILGEMVLLGFVRRDVGGRYLLGGRAYRLGLQIGDSGAFSASVRTVLVEASSALEMTVAFGYLDRTTQRLVYADRCDANGPVRYVVKLGAPLELHSRALGKLLLSHEPESAWADWLGSEPYVAKASRTHTRFEPMAAELRHIRSTATAWTESEQYDGIGGCARPIYAYDGLVAAGIAVQGLADSVERRRDQVLEVLTAAADALGSELKSRRIASGALPLYI